MKPYVIESVLDSGNECGIKVRVTETCANPELQTVGEHVARGAIECPGTEQVFVWVYGSEMSTSGPAALLTWQKSGEEPYSSLTDCRLIVWHYLNGPVAQA